MTHVTHLLTHDPLTHCWLLWFGCNLQSNVCDAQVNRGRSLWDNVWGGRVSPRSQLLCCLWLAGTLTGWL